MKYLIICDGQQFWMEADNLEHLRSKFKDEHKKWIKAYEVIGVKPVARVIKVEDVTEWDLEVILDQLREEETPERQKKIEEAERKMYEQLKKKFEGGE